MKLRLLLSGLLILSASVQAEDPIQKRRLGPNINTPYAEILPIAAADGQLLFITRVDYPDPVLRKHVEDKFTVDESNCHDLGPALEALAASEGKEMSP